VRDLFDKIGADMRRASGGKQILAVYSQYFETAYLGGRSVVAVQPEPGNDVYIVGYGRNVAGNSVACYRKNGIKTTLSDGSSSASAKAITVSGKNYT
jgi:hypothetical protein